MTDTTILAASTRPTCRKTRQKRCEREEHCRQSRHRHRRGGGLGEAAARWFAEEGAKLVLGDLGEEGLAKLADELGGEGEVKRTDVSEMADCEALVAAAVDRFGRVDVVFANAGVDHLRKVDEGPLSDFTKVIETDLYGFVHMNRAAIAELRTSKECIVNMSSVSASEGTGVTASTAPPRAASPTSPARWHWTRRRTASASTR